MNFSRPLPNLKVRLLSLGRQIVTLGTPTGRLCFFGGITIFVLFVPYNWLERAHLSLYERLHIPSPSIGLTRAYWKLLHGDPVGAWHRNPLIYAVLILVLALILQDGWRLYRRRID